MVADNVNLEHEQVQEENTNWYQIIIVYTDMQMYTQGTHLTKAKS